MRSLLLTGTLMMALAGSAGAASFPPGFPQEDPPASVAQSPDPDLEEEVWSFLEAFIDGENTPARQLDFFADRVHYYDQGVVSKPAIARDIRYTMRRWPWRDNRLVEIEYLKPLPEENRIFVSYVVDYEVAAEGRAVRGRARYGAVIAGIDVDGPARIEAIFENVTRRERLHAAP